MVENEGKSTIVIGVDGSESSKEALHWGAHQAKMTGADLRVIMAWETPYLANGSRLPLPTGYDYRSAAASVLKDAISEVLGDHPFLTVHAELVEGNPVPPLLLASHGADLLVVGSRGHGGFVGMLLGSVSQHCITYASCPVVVVRSGAVAQEGDK